MQIAIAEAKAKFADLIRRVERGEPVVITRHGRPVAEMHPPVSQTRRPLIGAMKGAFTLPEAAFDGDSDLDDAFHESEIDPQ